MSFENHHHRQLRRLNHPAFLIEPQQLLENQNPSSLNHRKLPSDLAFRRDNIAPPTFGAAQHLSSQSHLHQKSRELVRSTIGEIITHPLIRYTKKDNPLYSYLIDRSIHLR